MPNDWSMFFNWYSNISHQTQSKQSEYGIFLDKTELSDPLDSQKTKLLITNRLYNYICFQDLQMISFSVVNMTEKSQSLTVRKLP